MPGPPSGSYSLTLWAMYVFYRYLGLFGEAWVVTARAIRNLCMKFYVGTIRGSKATSFVGTSALGLTGTCMKGAADL